MPLLNNFGILRVPGKVIPGQVRMSFQVDCEYIGINCVVATMLNKDKVECVYNSDKLKDADKFLKIGYARESAYQGGIIECVFFWCKN